METYVVDAHSLVWFISADDRLSNRAKMLLEQAENADIQVLIPTIVLAEITYIAQRKKVGVSIDDLLGIIEQGSGFIIVPFDFLIFRSMLKVPDEWDIHDRIIGATGHYYNAIIITRDLVLSNSKEIETVW